MREKKYRAWANGKMHYPTEEMWWYFSSTGYWSLNIGDGMGEIICDSLESKDATLMDFTDLLDKHGKQIYERDIVLIDMWHGVEKGYEPEKFEVKWINHGFKFIAPDGFQWNLSKDYGIEIIGNIFQDKDLLK